MAWVLIKPRVHYGTADMSSDRSKNGVNENDQYDVYAYYNESNQCVARLWVWASSPMELVEPYVTYQMNLNDTHRRTILSGQADTVEEAIEQAESCLRQQRLI